jgi:hypothetical protein
MSIGNNIRFYWAILRMYWPRAKYGFVILLTGSILSLIFVLPPAWLGLWLIGGNYKMYLGIISILFAWDSSMFINKKLKEEWKKGYDEKDDSRKT